MSALPSHYFQNPRYVPRAFTLFHCNRLPLLLQEMLAQEKLDTNHHLITDKVLPNRYCENQVRRGIRVE